MTSSHVESSNGEEASCSFRKAFTSRYDGEAKGPAADQDGDFDFQWDDHENDDGQKLPAYDAIAKSSMSPQHHQQEIEGGRQEGGRTNALEETDLVFNTSWTSEAVDPFQAQENTSKTSSLPVGAVHATVEERHPQSSRPQGNQTVGLQ